MLARNYLHGFHAAEQVQTLTPNVGVERPKAIRFIEAVRRLMNESTKGRMMNMSLKRGQWRRVLRPVIDIAALYVAWSVQFAASGSHAAAAITASAVGAYGLWCFYDGAS